MLYLIILLFSPIFLFAQYTFGPSRLDDGRGESYYYPVLQPSPEGNLLSLWAAVSDSVIQASGRRINFDGSLDGGHISYQEAIPFPITCPAKINVYHLSNGGEARLIYHA